MRLVVHELGHDDVSGLCRDLDHDVEALVDPSDAVVLADQRGEIRVEHQVAVRLALDDIIVHEVVVLETRQRHGHLGRRVAEQADVGGADGAGAVEDSEAVVGVLGLRIPAFCRHGVSPQGRSRRARRPHKANAHARDTRIPGMGRRCQRVL